MSACVTRQLHRAGHVHDFRRPVVEVSLQFCGETFQQIGGAFIPVAAQNGRVIAPRANTLGDCHGLQGVERYVV